MSKDSNLSLSYKTFKPMIRWFVNFNKKAYRIESVSAFLILAFLATNILISCPTVLYSIIHEQHSTDLCNSHDGFIDAKKKSCEDQSCDHQMCSVKSIQDKNSSNNNNQVNLTFLCPKIVLYQYFWTETRGLAIPRIFFIFNIFSQLNAILRP